METKAKIHIVCSAVWKTRNFFSWNFLVHTITYIIIGGHGFWGRGGVYTGGVEIFFLGVILLVDPGVILPKIVKLGVPSGPLGAPPLPSAGGVFRVILGFRGVCTPTHPSPVPILSHLWWSIRCLKPGSFELDKMSK